MIDIGRNTQRLRAHRDELGAELANDGPWIVSSGGTGASRLVVATAPPWPSTVFRAAALVDVLDERARNDRPDAQDVASQLDAALAALRVQGIDAWLVC